jgi:hypothetical protein
MPVSRMVPEHGSGLEAVAVRARAVRISDVYRNMCFMELSFVGVISAFGCFSFSILVPGIRGEVPKNFQDN